jgi:ribonuclease HI
MKDILIFTDGSARGNPGPGGWGSIVVANGKVFELGGNHSHTTNNKMELAGAIGALEFVKREIKNPSPITIISDSEYVVKGMNEWLPNWKKNNWRTASRKPVLNQESWQKLSELSENLKIEWKNVLGHSGHEANERCDMIATSFADENPVTLFQGDIKKYPIKM